MHNVFFYRKAYCLMKYQSEDQVITEILWNSRDGVTPFIIPAKDGETRLQHVEFEKDELAIWHVPAIGSRIFKDQPFEVWIEKEIQRTRRFWDHPDFAHLVAQYQTPEKLVIASAGEFRKGQPCVEVVDAAFHSYFQARALRQSPWDVSKTYARWVESNEQRLDDIRAELERFAAKDNVADEKVWEPKDVVHGHSRRAAKRAFGSTRKKRNFIGVPKKKRRKRNSKR